MDGIRAAIRTFSPVPTASSTGERLGRPRRQHSRLAAVGVLAATLGGSTALAAIAATVPETTSRRGPPATDARLAQQGPTRWEPRGEPVFPPLGYDPAAEWAARRKQQQAPTETPAPARVPAQQTPPAALPQPAHATAAEPPATGTLQPPAPRADGQRTAVAPPQPPPPYHAGYAPPGMPPYEAMQPIPPQWQVPPQLAQPQPYGIQPSGSAGVFHPQAPSHVPYPQGPYPAVAPVWTPYGWQLPGPAFQPQQPPPQPAQSAAPSGSAERAPPHSAPRLAPIEQPQSGPARQMEATPAAPAVKDLPLRWGGVSTGGR